MRTIAENTIIVINGTQYTIMPEDYTHGGDKGFDGREFKIRLQNGEEIITHNLWCQGETKEPNNAAFIKDLTPEEKEQKIKDLMRFVKPAPGVKVCGDISNVIKELKELGVEL